MAGVNQGAGLLSLGFFGGAMWWSGNGVARLPTSSSKVGAAIDARGQAPIQTVDPDVFSGLILIIAALVGVIAVLWIKRPGEKSSSDEDSPGSNVNGPPEPSDSADCAPAAAPNDNRNGHGPRPTTQSQPAGSQEVSTNTARSSTSRTAAISSKALAALRRGWSGSGSTSPNDRSAS